MLYEYVLSLHIFVIKKSIRFYFNLKQEPSDHQKRVIECQAVDNGIITTCFIVLIRMCYIARMNDTLSFQEKSMVYECTILLSTINEEYPIFQQPQSNNSIFDLLEVLTALPVDRITTLLPKRAGQRWEQITAVKDVKTEISFGLAPPSPDAEHDSFWSSVYIIHEACKQSIS